MDLKQQLEEARKRLKELEFEYRQTVAEKEISQLIGKCFLRRRDYEDSYCVDYARVLSREDLFLSVLVVCQESDGRFAVDQICIRWDELGSYIPITEADHRAAVAPILATIKERAGL